MKRDFADSQEFRRQYAANPRSACSGPGGSLCTAQATNDEESDAYIRLMLASSPASYSSLNVTDTGGTRVIAPPRAQRVCYACAAFTVVAAAEAAVARVLMRDVVTDVGTLSVQQLYFCSAQPRGCYSALRLRDALEELLRRPLLLDRCLPYKPDTMDLTVPGELCESKAQLCSDYSAATVQGRFGYRDLTQIWQVQQWIRNYGAVVTRLDVMSDFRSFFGVASNAKKVYKPSKNATVDERHAIILVGYSNPGGFWIARNSWGGSFADGGAFRIAFGACNVAAAGDTYGVSWAPFEAVADVMLRRPNLEAPPPGSLAPNRRGRGCKVYKARPGDYLSRVAFLLRVPLAALLRDNAGTIRDPGRPLAGESLLICPPGKKSTGAAGSDAAAVPGWWPYDAPVDPIESELQALLAVRATIDRADVMSQWVEEGGRRGRYCNWGGIVCDQDMHVTSLELWTQDFKSRALHGVLPSAEVLAKLPRLKVLALSDAGLVGSLPPGYSRLTGLDKLRLSGNFLRGPLRNWTALTNLKELYLDENNLEGTLPQQMPPNLELLGLDTNALTGSLPAEWASLKHLRRLWLNNNELSGELPPALGPAWANMTTLRLNHNRLSGTVPESWGEGMRGLDKDDTTLHHNPGLRGCIPGGFSRFLGSGAFTNKTKLEDRLCSSGSGSGSGSGK